MDSQLIEITEIEDAPEALPAPVVLTEDEDNYALAYVESGGNPAAAYRMVFGEDRFASSKGQQLLARPGIVARVTQISAALTDAQIMSTGAHLHELAVIRDLAKDMAEYKVALDAEVKRGEVAGLYTKNQPKGGAGNNVAVQVNLVSKYDATI